MDGWHAGIGDPTLLGWLTVIAYVGGALLCFRCYRLSFAAALSSDRNPVARLERTFWLATSMMLLALGVNKQLDLQGFITAFARTLAKEEGWYQWRRPAQYAFVILVAAIGGAAVIAMLWACRRAGGWVQLAEFGAIILGAFVVIRAASFHHVDEWLGTSIWLFNLNHVLELCGIGLISAAAIGAASRS